MLNLGEVLLSAGKLDQVVKVCDEALNILDLINDKPG